MLGIKTKLQGLKKKLTKKGLILMYHRICEPVVDPWDLAVSPENFEQQLKVLQKHYKICSIPEILKNLSKGRIKQNCIALTFDDGYRDNFYNGRPLLEKYDVPATFFIPTGNLLKNRSYWWDALQDIILTSPLLPERLSINIAGASLSFSLQDEHLLSNTLKLLHQQWVVDDEPPTRRAVLFKKLWQMLQPLNPNEIEIIMIEIRSWAGCDKELTSQIMSREEVKKLADNPLFHVGLHTVNHIALSCHSEEIQKKEIIQNNVELKQITNNDAVTIAYPYGEYNSSTLQVVKDLNLKAGFTVEFNPVVSSSSRFKLGRFHVKNWNGEQFEEHLKNWSEL